MSIIWVADGSEQVLSGFFIQMVKAFVLCYSLRPRTTAFVVNFINKAYSAL